MKMAIDEEDVMRTHIPQQGECPQGVDTAATPPAPISPLDPEAPAQRPYAGLQTGGDREFYII